MNYSRINWEDSPSTNTPINAENLNKMDKGISDLATECNNLQPKTDNNLETESKNIVTAINQINADKIERMSDVSGYQTVDVLGYNPTTKKLGLKVNGADTVIPFSGGLYANPDITKRIKKLDTTAYTLSKDLVIYGSFYTSNINIGLQYSKNNGSTWLDLFQGENYGGSAYAGIVTVPPTLIPKGIRLKFNSSVGSSVALYEKLERPVLADLTQRVTKLSHTDVYTCNEDLVLYGTFFTRNINDGVTYSLDGGTTWLDLLQGANYGGTGINDYLNIPPVLIPKNTQIKITSNWNGAGTPYLYKPLS